MFDLLVYLVRNRDRVVSKDDLIDSVWGGRIVSDSALTSRLNAARKAVNDSGAEQRVIRTVQRRGVRFIGEVSEDSEPAAGIAAAPAATEAPTAPRLSIVVLPFVNLSNDPEQQYFADGVTGDLITDLSRIPDMLVISRNSAFTYRDQAGRHEADRARARLRACAMSRCDEVSRASRENRPVYPRHSSPALSPTPCGSYRHVEDLPARRDPATSASTPVKASTQLTRQSLRPQ